MNKFDTKIFTSEGYEIKKCFLDLKTSNIHIVMERGYEDYVGGLNYNLSNGTYDKYPNWESKRNQIGSGANGLMDYAINSLKMHAYNQGDNELQKINIYLASTIKDLIKEGIKVTTSLECPFENKKISFVKFSFDNGDFKPVEIQYNAEKFDEVTPEEFRDDLITEIIDFDKTKEIENILSALRKFIPEKIDVKSLKDSKHISLNDKEENKVMAKEKTVEENQKIINDALNEEIPLKAEDVASKDDAKEQLYGRDVINNWDKTYKNGLVVKHTVLDSHIRGCYFDISKIPGNTEATKNKEFDLIQMYEKPSKFNGFKHVKLWSCSYEQLTSKVIGFAEGKQIEKIQEKIAEREAKKAEKAKNEVPVKETEAKEVDLPEEEPEIN